MNEVTAIVLRSPNALYYCSVRAPFIFAGICDRVELYRIETVL